MAGSETDPWTYCNGPFGLLSISRAAEFVFFFTKSIKRRKLASIRQLCDWFFVGTNVPNWIASAPRSLDMAARKVGGIRFRQVHSNSSTLLASVYSEIECASLSLKCTLIVAFPRYFR